MDEMRILLCVVFGFGVVLESMLLVGLGEEGLATAVLASLGIAVSTSVFFYLYAAELGLYTRVLICFVIFLFFLALMFKKKILPVVNERMLLVLNMALWYFFLIHYRSFSGTLNLIIWLILLTLGGLLTANLYLEFIPDHLAINSLIVVAPQIISRRFRTAVQSEKERLQTAER